MKVSFIEKKYDQKDNLSYVMNIFGKEIHFGSAFNFIFERRLPKGQLEADFFLFLIMAITLFLTAVINLGLVGLLLMIILAVSLIYVTS